MLQPVCCEKLKGDASSARELNQRFIMRTAKMRPFMPIFAHACIKYVDNALVELYS
jgi:hypothetical protein